MTDINDNLIDGYYQKLRNEAEDGGYNLNPDEETTKILVKGLLVNKERYGYQSCPCRLSSGDRSKDLDIICPCDYRDSDINKYNSCYCGLYVSKKIVQGVVKLKSIPESRPTKNIRENMIVESKDKKFATFTIPVWRCSVCGYLCAREQPPETCPICKVSQDRFKKFE